MNVNEVSDFIEYCQNLIKKNSLNGESSVSIKINKDRFSKSEINSIRNNFIKNNLHISWKSYSNHKKDELTLKWSKSYIRRNT